MASGETLRSDRNRSGDEDLTQLFQELTRPLDPRSMMQGLARMSVRITSPGYRRSIGSAY
jgi:hypothetical protein